MMKHMMTKRAEIGTRNSLLSIPNLDEEGTLGAIPSAILTLVIFSMIFLAMGTVVDEIVRTENILMDTDNLPYSQQKHDTIDFLVTCFKAMVFVALICVVLFLIMNGIQKQSGAI